MSSPDFHRYRRLAPIGWSCLPMTQLDTTARWVSSRVASLQVGGGFGLLAGAVLAGHRATVPGA
ncbi:hypothetical protein KI248_gp10 [Mycobacterium phage Phaded]|uniref:Uncharacterized protein n=1 Tax=Mycobacterium phage Phaded TaxID=2686088 RepID=A0A6B9JB16_9CAUD|nr:hypothetical protein KI248_gp10 [Mycobacterium phage Phaded]QGZ16889.1 hypothetical protein SEA_PHADED_89 [Mycobacterium phage Phaded]